MSSTRLFVATSPPLSSDASISDLIGASPDPVAKMRIFGNACEGREKIEKGTCMHSGGSLHTSAEFAWARGPDLWWGH